MKFLNKLKTERQDLISSLNENIEALEKIAYEQQIEIDNLHHYKQSYEELKAEHLELIRNIKPCQTEAIKEVVKKAKMECARIFNMKDRMTMLIALDAIEKEMVGGSDV